METILIGVLVLFCAGFIVGQSQLFMHEREAPKKESEHQMMIRVASKQDLKTEADQEKFLQDQENLPSEQNRTEVRE